MKKLMYSMLVCGLGIGAILAAALEARAMNGPQAIPVDLGPLGTWDVLGGIDGYGAVVSNPIPDGSGRENPTNAAIANAQIHIVKPSGLVRFNVEIGAYSFPVIGYADSPKILYTRPRAGQIYTDPVHFAAVSLNPSDHFSIEIGKLTSLEGFEYGRDWKNPNFFLSGPGYDEIGTGRGVQANFSYGPVTLNAQFSDGYYTKQFNYVQAALTYTLNPASYVYFYGGFNAGRTIIAGKPAASAFDNSNMVGGGINYVVGKLTLQPYVQYQWTPKDPVVGAAKTYGYMGAVLSTDYQVSKQWSVGSQIAWVGSNTDKADRANAAIYGDWFGFGAGVSYWSFQVNPTWQYKNVFVRPVMAYVHLSHYAQGQGFGADRGGPGQFYGVLELGFLL